MRDAYLAESGDDTDPLRENLTRVIVKLRDGENDPIALWLLRQDGVLQGYSITDIIWSAGVRSCFIREAWIAPALRRTNAFYDGLTAIEAYARKIKCARMDFGTMRNPRAYNRMLRRLGWRTAEAYFAKKLEVLDG